MGGTWGLAGSIPGTGDTVSFPVCLRWRTQCVLGPFLAGITRRVVLRLVVPDCLEVLPVLLLDGEYRDNAVRCAAGAGIPGTRSSVVHPLVQPRFYILLAEICGRGIGRNCDSCAGELRMNVYLPSHMVYFGSGGAHV